MQLAIPQGLQETALGLVDGTVGEGGETRPYPTRRRSSAARRRPSGRLRRLGLPSAQHPPPPLTHVKVAPSALRPTS